MKKKWCVREGAFIRDDGLWWLKNEHNISANLSGTPMTVALKNGGISRVIDVKQDGLIGRRRAF